MFYTEKEIQDFKYYFMVINTYSKAIGNARTKEEKDYFCMMLSRYLDHWEDIKHMFRKIDRDAVDQRLSDPPIKEVFLEYLLKRR